MRVSLVQPTGFTSRAAIVRSFCHGGSNPPFVGKHAAHVWKDAADVGKDAAHVGRWSF